MSGLCMRHLSAIVGGPDVMPSRPFPLRTAGPLRHRPWPLLAKIIAPHLGAPFGPASRDAASTLEDLKKSWADSVELVGIAWCIARSGTTWATQASVHGRDRCGVRVILRLARSLCDQNPTPPASYDSGRGDSQMGSCAPSRSRLHPKYRESRSQNPELSVGGIAMARKDLSCGETRFVMRGREVEAWSLERRAKCRP